MPSLLLFSYLGGGGHSPTYLRGEGHLLIQEEMAPYPPIWEEMAYLPIQEELGHPFVQEEMACSTMEEKVLYLFGIGLPIYLRRSGSSTYGGQDGLSA